jgi:hypothetical protein
MSTNRSLVLSRLGRGIGVVGGEDYTWGPGLGEEQNQNQEQSQGPTWSD